MPPAPDFGDLGQPADRLARTASSDPDDVFAETRMSFGDHIEELRTRMIRAIVGMLVVLLGGFILDSVGHSLGSKTIGVFRPLLGIITEPVETMMRDFNARRNDKAKAILAADVPDINPEDTENLRKRLAEEKGSTNSFSEAEKAQLRRMVQPLAVEIPVDAFAKAFNLTPADPGAKTIKASILVRPAEVEYLARSGEVLLENKKYLTTLSAQEGMVVYFKVAILSALIIASPWVLYQMWAFVAAGLYPQERAYVYRLFGPSVALFLCGVVMWQFVVAPGAVSALIAFNNFIDVDPDLRLNEWLSLALIMPLVFGISFQTPLVMIALNRLGVFSGADYLGKWRQAFMGLAVFSAVITPTPDVITMMYLFVPMFALYMLGIAVCHFFPPPHEAEDAAEAEAERQVAV